MYDEDDYGDEERVILRTPKGRAAVLPKSAARLKGEALEVYADLMTRGIQVAELEADTSRLAREARLLGVSWGLIGAAVGLTGEGARRRYGAEDD